MVKPKKKSHTKKSVGKPVIAGTLLEGHCNASQHPLTAEASLVIPRLFVWRRFAADDLASPCEERLCSA